MKISASSAAALGQVGLLLACSGSTAVAQPVPVTAPAAAGACFPTAGESCPAAATMSGCVMSVMHSSGLFPHTWGNDSMAVVRCFPCSMCVHVNLHLSTTRLCCTGVVPQKLHCRGLCRGGAVCDCLCMPSHPPFTRPPRNVIAAYLLGFPEANAS